METATYSYLPSTYMYFLLLLAHQRDGRASDTLCGSALRVFADVWSSSQTSLGLALDPVAMHFNLGRAGRFQSVSSQFGQGSIVLFHPCATVYPKP